MVHPLPKSRYAFVCAVCGGEQVTREAWATWDVDVQGWVLDVVFDTAWCHRCMGAVRLDQVVLTSPSTFSAPGS
ncbi:MAG: hypothetical protein AB7E60_05820 [Sphingobium sp.]